jgi:hypothetical protein
MNIYGIIILAQAGVIILLIAAVIFIYIRHKRKIYEKDSATVRLIRGNERMETV